MPNFLSRKLAERLSIFRAACARILLDPCHPAGARQIAAAALARSIHAGSFRALVRLREAWTASGDLADLTKRAIRAALACGDAVIRNQAARSFAASSN
jgi:hypothetical protein